MGSENNNKMEDTSAITNREGQVRSPPHLSTEETQRENEERFDRLQTQMTNLKVLMEQL